MAPVDVAKTGAVLEDDITVGADDVIDDITVVVVNDDDVTDDDTMDLEATDGGC